MTGLLIDNPLSGRVLVAEPAEIVSLTVNDTSGIVTLNESADDTLTLSCVARGVPSPPLRLLRVSVAQYVISSQAAQGKCCTVCHLLSGCSG